MARIPFPYSSLAGCKDQFRLLRLYLDHDDTPLRCSLRPFNLWNAPRYSALSYVWGSPQKTHTIFVDNEHVCHITSSLALALHDVETYLTTYFDTRSDKPDGVEIWADGICVNQKDVKEREAQVPLMGSIYSGARKVLTYTGPVVPGNGGDADFPAFMHQVCAYCEREYLANYAGPIDRTPRFPIQDPTMPSESDPGWHQLKVFFIREWPRRSWITQETLLASDTPILLHGRHGIPFEISLALLFFGQRAKWPAAMMTVAIDGDATATLSNLGVLRQSFRQGKATVSLTLNHLLYRCYDNRCSDPRDKIYSLMNLASDWTSFAIDVDYSISPESLFATVAAKIINTTHSTTLISTVGPQELDLPSWVPDWSQNRRADCLTLDETGPAKDGTYLYAAGGNGLSNMRVDEDSNTLTLRAAKFDQIYYATPEIDVQGWDLPKLILQCAKCHELTWPEQEIYYPTQQTILDATWLTWIAGRTGEIKKATIDNCKASFDSYLHSNPRRIDNDTPREALSFTRAVSHAAYFRSWAITNRGFMGLVPSTAERGDIVCIVPGAQTPFILREKGADYVLIGECYIHGIMDGEALDDESLVFEDIRLV